MRMKESQLHVIYLIFKTDFREWRSSWKSLEEISAFFRSYEHLEFNNDMFFEEHFPWYLTWKSALDSRDSDMCIPRGKSSSEILNFSEKPLFLGNFWSEYSSFLVVLVVFLHFLLLIKHAFNKMFLKCKIPKPPPGYRRYEWFILILNLNIEGIYK